MPHRHVAPQRRAGPAHSRLGLLLGAGELQTDNPTGGRRPQAMRRATDASPGESGHRKDVREKFAGLGEEMERSY